MRAFRTISISLILAGALLGQQGFGGYRQFKWYVDPSGGNDTNSGLSSAAPVKTQNALAGKSGYTLGDTIGVLENSQWKRSAPAVSGMVAYYRASTFTGSQGASTGAWADASGNGYTATVSGTQPILNYQTTTGKIAVLTSKGAASSLTLPAGISLSRRSLSLIVIGEPVASDLQIVGGSLGTANQFLPSLSYSTNYMRLCVYYNSGPSCPSGAAPIAWGPQLYGITSSATTAKFWNNTTGTNITLLTAATITGGTISSSQTGEYMIGNIYELLVYNRELVAADMTALSTYVKAVYGTYGGLNGAYTQQIATAGDSITSGYVTSNTGKGWVQQAKFQLPLVRMVDIAVQGSQTSGLQNPDSFYSGGLSKNVVTVWSGTNDLALSVATATVLTNIANYVAARRATGWSVITMTILPRNGAANPNFAVDRATVNAALVANAGGIYGDVIANVGADSTLSNPSNATYYVDGIHLTDAGNAIVVNSYVMPALATLGVTP